MPTQKKFFVLSANYNPTIFPTKLLCIFATKTPQEVAKLLSARRYSFSNVRDGGFRGIIFLHDDLFQPSKKAGKESYLEYNCGVFQLFLHKESWRRPECYRYGMELSLEELPVMGKCEWRQRQEWSGTPKCCDAIGTLFADDCKMLCPDAYRLLVDDNYKEDKKAK